VCHVPTHASRFCFFEERGPPAFSGTRNDDAGCVRVNDWAWCLHVHTRQRHVRHAPLTRHTRHRSCHTFWQLHQPRRRPPARNSLPEDKRYWLSRWPDLHCALNRTESDRTQISCANIPLCGGQTALRGNKLFGCVPMAMSKVNRRHPGNSGRLVPSFLNLTTSCGRWVIQWTLLFAAEEAVEKDRRALQLRRARAAGIWCFLFPLDTVSWSR
jgi:hypothetical protein